MSPDEPLALFNAGYYLQAHEAWEALWRAEGEPLRKRRLQGLAQLAAVFVKRDQGSPAGAARILDKARRSLREAGSGADPWDVERALAELDGWLAPGARPRLHPR